MKLKKFFFACIVFNLLFLINSSLAQDAPANFKLIVDARLRKTYGTTLEKICPTETDATARRIFSEYGAIFVSARTALPGRCIFTSDADVQSFQTGSVPQTAKVGGVEITLQKAAMEALLKAVQDAAKQKLRITPRGGSLAAARSFQNTVDLWNSRFYPALNFWTAKKKIARGEAEAAKILPVREQVARVLEWEASGLFFSKDLQKSILYSVAAPGASQHNFLLALDVEQFADKNVRRILADNGWFQTVKSDLPHFTYLGAKETDLSALGLKAVTVGSQKFWIPNVDF